MIARQIAQPIQDLLSHYPIISVTGPRQSGKTTLLRGMFPEYRYVNFENPDSRLFFEQDPNGFLREYDKMVVFDEAQRVPALFSYLQVKVDEDKIMGQFILSGSQNFLLLEKITQSLAGRVAIFRLLPLSHAELEASDPGLKPAEIEAAIYWGGYPVLYDRKTEPAVYFQSYLETYAERDVRSVLNVKDLNAFQIFLRLCAGRVGQPVNLQALATEAAISVQTVRNWLSVLEASYILFQLPPFFENFNKRLVKSHKLYFYDTGLLCYLLGIAESTQIQQHYSRGSLFENLVIVELMKNRYNRNRRPDFYFWKDNHHVEVDLVSLEGLSTNLFEMKYSFTPKAEFFKGIQSFRNNAPEHRSVGNNYVIYAGDEGQHRSAAKIESWRNLGNL
ncbi:MAG: ATP-binding protein [Saprospiraceae bacterium]|nr:ATP-binding protein [Saprospiraceae bacterium]